MCGIIGYIGNIADEHAEDAFTLLNRLFESSLTRGAHATGFAASYRGNNLVVADKRPVPSPKFVKRSDKFKRLRAAMPAVFIGHTRHTTSGDAKIGRNNHPFIGPRYAMVHNGVLKDWHKTANSLDIKLRTDTDSELLLHILEKHEDPFVAIQNIEDLVDGDMAVAALTHHGDEKQRLVLYRNDGRPLWMAKMKQWNSIWFASTKDILEMSLKATFPKNTVPEIESLLGLTFGEYPEYNTTCVTLGPKGIEAIAHKTIVKRGTNKPNEAPNPIKTIGPVNLPVKADGPIPGQSATQEQLSKATPETQGRVQSLVEMASSAAGILTSIQENDFMTAEEIKHWRNWRANLS
jgi:hypothetical protein